MCYGLNIYCLFQDAKVQKIEYTTDSLMPDVNQNTQKTSSLKSHWNVIYYLLIY
jgi:hypothetical protein